MPTNKQRQPRLKNNTSQNLENWSGFGRSFFYDHQKNFAAPYGRRMARGELTMPEDLDFIFADVDDILNTWQTIHLDTEFDPYYPDIDDIALESGNITYDDR